MNLPRLLPRPLGTSAVLQRVLSGSWATLLSLVRTQSWILPTVLFLAAALPRLWDIGAVMTVDEPMWLVRVHNFVQAIRGQDWAGTMQSGHPGVTTLWLSGAGMAAQLLLWRLTGQPRPDFGPDGLLPFVTAARLPMALLSAGFVVVVYLLLCRLVPRPAALTAALVVAWDPFFVGLSRIVHVDAALAIFMVTSLLAFLVHLERGGWRHLALSSLAGGLAFLTKTPSFLLLAVLGLVWLLHLRGLKAAGVRQSVRRAGLWLAGALLTVVLLWPALWAAAASSLGYVYERTALHVGETHAGGSYALAPGYYVTALLTYSTPGTFLLIVALAPLALLALRWVRVRALLSQTPLPQLGLFAVVVFLAMTVSAKKGERYLLPSFLALDLALALLLAGTLAYRLHPRLRAAPVVLLGLALGSQAFLLAAYHPQYLAARNHLWPVPADARLGLGEGLEAAALRLNARGDYRGVVVSSWYENLFAQYFEGLTVHLDKRSEPFVDYVVLYRNMYQRQGDPEESQLVREWVRDLPAEEVVELGGLAYAWVFPSPARLAVYRQALARVAEVPGPIGVEPTYAPVVRALAPGAEIVEPHASGVTHVLRFLPDETPPPAGARLERRWLQPVYMQGVFEGRTPVQVIRARCQDGLDAPEERWRGQYVLSDEGTQQEGAQVNPGDGLTIRISPPFPGEATEYGLFTRQAWEDGHRFTVQVDPQATEMKEGVSIRVYAAPAAAAGPDLAHAVLLEWELRDAPPGRPILKTFKDGQRVKESVNGEMPFPRALRVTYVNGHVAGEVLGEEGWRLIGFVQVPAWQKIHFGFAARSWIGVPYLEPRFSGALIEAVALPPAALHGVELYRLDGQR